jgi:hypothetical protein
MSSFAEIVPDIRVRGVQVDEDRLTVDLMDGRSISVPLAWYPRLLAATSEQRQGWQTAGGGYGIHWPENRRRLEYRRITERCSGAVNFT